MDIVAKIKASSFIKNTLKLSSSSVILMLLPLVVTPILSRLYTPEDYGLWGIFSSTLYIINAFVCLSYEYTIVKSDDEGEIGGLLTLCAIVSGVMISLIGIVFIIGRLLSIGYFVEFPSIAWLIATLVISFFNSMGICLTNRLNKYGALSISNILNGFLQASIRIYLGFFPIISYGLIVGNALSHLLASIFLLYVLYRYLSNINWKDISFKHILSLSKKYSKFPIYDAPARFLEFTVGNIVVIILSFYFGRGDVGCFSMVLQFILLPITVVGSAMGSVYYRELSENCKSIESIQSVTRKVAKLTFYLSIVPMIFLTFGGDKLLVLFLGEKWIYAGRMALIMSIYSFPVILTEPLLPAFRVLDCQKIRFKYNLINLFVSVGSLVVASLLFHDVFYSLLVYSLTYAIIRFAIYRRILKSTSLQISYVSKLFFPTIIICYIALFIRLILF